MKRYRTMTYTNRIREIMPNMITKISFHKNMMNIIHTWSDATTTLSKIYPNVVILSLLGNFNLEALKYENLKRNAPILYELIQLILLFFHCNLSPGRGSRKLTIFKNSWLIIDLKL